MRFRGSFNSNAGHSNQCGWLGSFQNPLKVASSWGYRIERDSGDSIYSNEIMRKVWAGSINKLTTRVYQHCRPALLTTCWRVFNYLQIKAAKTLPINAAAAPTWEEISGSSANNKKKTLQSEQIIMNKCHTGRDGNLSKFPHNAQHFPSKAPKKWRRQCDPAP